jgi:hypothetical protein
MKAKTKLPPNVKLDPDLSPLGRVREVTKRLLAVPKEEIDRREQEAKEARISNE